MQENPRLSYADIRGRLVDENDVEWGWQVDGVCS